MINCSENNLKQRVCEPSDDRCAWAYTRLNSIFQVLHMHCTSSNLCKDAGPSCDLLMKNRDVCCDYLCCDSPLCNKPKYLQGRLSSRKKPTTKASLHTLIVAPLTGCGDWRGRRGSNRKQRNLRLTCSIIVPIISKPIRKREVFRMSVASAVFKWVTNVIWNFFGFASFCFWLVQEKSRQPIRCTTKTNHVLVACVFPRVVFTLNTHRFFKVFSLFLIGCCNWFGFGFTTIHS